MPCFPVVTGPLSRVSSKKKLFSYLKFMGPCIVRIFQNTTRCNVTPFILSGNCSTCFGWYVHPSSGAHTTVSTVSGICHTVTANCRSLFPSSSSSTIAAGCSKGLFISGNCSTCFGWYHHPSSGAHTTVSTASGICHTVTATCCYSGR